MARFTCVRCKVTYHVVNGLLPDGSTEHLCKDVAARLRRRERQVTAVCDILFEAGVYMPHPEGNLPLAQAIVTRLSHIGVESDT